MMPGDMLEIAELSSVMINEKGSWLHRIMPHEGHALYVCDYRPDSALIYILFRGVFGRVDKHMWKCLGANAGEAVVR